MSGWVLWALVACGFAVGEVLSAGAFFLGPFAVGGALAAGADAVGAGELGAWLVFVIVSIMTLAVVRTADSHPPAQLATHAYFVAPPPWSARRRWLWRRSTTITAWDASRSTARCGRLGRSMTSGRSNLGRASR